MSDEKTEKPSKKKIDDARAKGQVPQRKNVLETFLLICVILYLASTWAVFYEKISALFDVSLTDYDSSFTEHLSDVVGPAMGALNYGVVLSIIAGIVILVVNLYLNGFNFAPKALTPKFEKLNPISGFKQIFSLQTLYNFIRLLIFFFCTSTIVVMMIWLNLKDGLSASVCGVVCLAPFFPPIFLKTVILILSVMLIMSVIDFKIQTFLFTKQNKMSKDEVKKEHKGSEGDPMIKSRRNSIARNDAALPQLKEVTHVLYSSGALVAMIYDKSEPDIPPYVVMKTREAGVQRFLQMFRSYKTKCVNLPSAANRLHKVALAGQYVDERGSMEVARMLEAAGDL